MVGIRFKNKYKEKKEISNETEKPQQVSLAKKNQCSVCRTQHVSIDNIGNKI